jgi:hypothetical protein
MLHAPLHEGVQNRGSKVRRILASLLDVEVYAPTALNSREVPAVSIGWIGCGAGLVVVVERIIFVLAGIRTSLYRPEAVYGTQLSLESVQKRR